MRPSLRPPTARTVFEAGEPEPPIELGPIDGVPVVESKRITPRSPRTALEPERVPNPPRRSRRARNPFVVAGNLFLTVIFLLTVASGVGFVIGKQRFDLPGPLPRDKVDQADRKDRKSTRLNSSH